MPAAEVPSPEPVTFARQLRAAGLAVPVSSVVTYVEALQELGVGRPDDVYWAGRVTLVHRVEDVPTYDRCFAEFFLGLTDPVADDESVDECAAEGSSDPDGPDPPSTGGAPGDQVDDVDRAPEDADDAGGSMRWSRAEILSRRDLATCSEAELAELWPVVASLRLSGARRPSRRRVPDPHDGSAPDMRRTVRESMRTGGEPVRPRHRRPSTRPRRVVLLVDVSGSMQPYARALLRFAHAAVLGRRSVEVFAMGTRLTRLTRDLGSHDPNAALRRADAAMPDYSGGTRLGDTLAEFNDRWGLRGMARGADVVVLSDGWDRGDPERLSQQMARLHRVTHRLVWVNPLRASPGYAPLARGMAAALAHVDEFVDGHSVASLADLADLLADDAVHRRRVPGRFAGPLPSTGERLDPREEIHR